MYKNKTVVEVPEKDYWEFMRVVFEARKVGLEAGTLLIKQGLDFFRKHEPQNQKEAEQALRLGEKLMKIVTKESNKKVKGSIS